MSGGTGLRTVHRRYVSFDHAHYAGGLVDGAFVLGLFGDVATEVCIRLDGDEGLFASYHDVQFRAPVYGGDVVEAEAVVEHVGRRSRRLRFQCRVVARARSGGRPGAATVLDPPIVAVDAVGTVVVPAPAEEVS
ncbi:hotdog domain-containing protein [Thermopolyspora sp. NPDC052614]|uniref:3-aminobutyryl-CoA ammonia lyase n=1 Tax=Thermopolyspora sp. NPDC052614 TaxID=3155682 RepID=UPI0034238571